MAETKKVTPKKKPAPKQPQDHTPKASDDKVVLSAGGRDWVVEQETLDDFEFLDDLGELEAGNLARLPRALKRLLGMEQYRDALELMRDKDTNRVSVDPVMVFFDELFDS